jgi:hypothetical protein
MSKKNKAEAPVGFRPPTNLRNKMDLWLTKNPGIDRSTMICIAIDKFISAPQVLEPVQVVVADQDMGMSVAMVMLEKHAHAIEKLK